MQAQQQPTQQGGIPPLQMLTFPPRPTSPSAPAPPGGVPPVGPQQSDSERNLNQTMEDFSPGGPVGVGTPGDNDNTGPGNPDGVTGAGNQTFGQAAQQFTEGLLGLPDSQAPPGENGGGLKGMAIGSLPSLAASAAAYAGGFPSTPFTIAIAAMRGLIRLASAAKRSGKPPSEPLGPKNREDLTPPPSQTGPPGQADGGPSGTPSGQGGAQEPNLNTDVSLTSSPTMGPPGNSGINEPAFVGTLPDNPGGSTNGNNPSDSGIGPGVGGNPGGEPGDMYRGGPVKGPKGRDKVPAHLTAGEYVIDKDSTQRFRKVLGQINTWEPRRPRSRAERP